VSGRKRWAEKALNLAAILGLVQLEMVCVVPEGDPLHHLSAEQVADVAADDDALSSLLVVLREQCQLHE
jgi:hypothetical protein